MKFRIGDIANGEKTSEQIIKSESYIKALEQVLNECNLYCEPVIEERGVTNNEKGI